MRTKKERLSPAAAERFRQGRERIIGFKNLLNLSNEKIGRRAGLKTSAVGVLLAKKRTGVDY